ncbi:MAG: low temperature requirement protein A, partial [Nitrososphaeraceae archaeon]
RTILVIEYLRTRRHVPEVHQLTTRYSIGFSIAAGIWLASAFVPSPIRFIFWIIGLGVDIDTPLLFARQLSVQFAPHVQHLPERFGSAFGVSVEHIVLSNQALALQSSEKWLLCASTFLCLLALEIIQMTSVMTNPMLSSANSKRAKYTAEIYSIGAAIAVLMLGATLRDSILLPVFLIGIMAVTCTGQVI